MVDLREKGREGRAGRREMRSREREAEGRREGERQRDGKSVTSEVTGLYVSFMLNHGLYTFDIFT